MKKKIRKMIMLVLLAVFVVSTALLIHQWMDNADGDAAYEDAMNIALGKPKEEQTVQSQPAQNQPESTAAKEKTEEPVLVWEPAPVENDPVMEEMAQIDLVALRETNEDVLGWIRVPGTKINYPLMQGEDNDFYLNHTWDKQPNSVGSIFLEHLNSPDLTDYNTIVYGHNMNNGSMFADVENFAVASYWETRRYVYILTDAGVYRYEIFAFFHAQVDSLTYGLNPKQDNTKEDFLNLALENSWIDTGVEPQLTDRILTLSTCSGADYGYRYVVQARLPMMEVEK